MKTLLAFTRPLFAALLLGCTAFAADEPIKGQRVFTAGHSLLLYMPAILTDVAAKAHVDGHVQAGVQGIGGSHVFQHWNLAGDRNTVKPALKSAAVDVLTLSPIYLPDDGIENLTRFALKSNPGVRVTVQEFWVPFEDPKVLEPRQGPKQVERDHRTVAELREMHAAYFASMDAHIRELNTKFGKQVLFIVPVGQAVVGLREKIIAGEAPGITKQSELFSDALGHARPPVQVLSTYCHFAVIYRRSPVGLPVPAALGKQAEAEKLNRLLQELAWQAVTTHPLSGVDPLQQASKGEADASSAAAQTAGAVHREIEAKLFPGAVVLVGTADRVLYHEAFGFAQVEPERVAMRKDSIFDVASVTKVVCTATAAGICKDRGWLDPDAPLTKYLPDHQGKDVDQISLRRLASHTSGFAENPRVSREGKLQGDAVFAGMLKDNPKWPVNTHYEYACRNIILLSTIVERVAGRPFGEFCAKEIFAPLEMRDSAFNHVEPSPRVVATHHPVLGENHNRDGLDAGCAVGNAGLFTTAGDLAHFCEMMLGGGQWHGRRVLTAETIADFTRNNQLPEFPGRGFVWETDVSSIHRPQRMSAKAYGHSGYTGISLWIDPDKRVYTLVLTNRTHPENVSKATERGTQQYRARARIAEAALAAFGY